MSGTNPANSSPMPPPPAASKPSLHLDVAKSTGQNPSSQANGFNFLKSASPLGTPKTPTFGASSIFSSKLPPVTPSSPLGRSGSPFGTNTDNKPVTCTWRFACGHEFKQDRKELFGTGLFQARTAVKDTRFKCPECAEQEDVHKKEREAARQKQEADRQAQEKVDQEASKQREQDQQLLATYKRRVQPIEQDIIDTGNNEEDRVHPMKMLEECRLMFSRMIKRKEMRALAEKEAKQGEAQAETQVVHSKMLKDMLVERKDTAELMCHRTEILYKRELEMQKGAVKVEVKEEGKVGVNEEVKNERADELKKTLAEWRAVSSKIMEATKSFQTFLEMQLTRIEGDVSVAWEQAVELMKRP